MTAILDSLKAEHVKFARYLDLFEAEVAKYEAGDSPDYEFIDLLVTYFTSFPDEWHHKKEDHVYDALTAKSAGAATGLYDLRAEHERLSGGVRAFAERIEQLKLGGDLPAETLIKDGQRYAAQLRGHMAREDEAFLPAAEAELSAAEWEAIARAVESELDAAGGAKLAAKLSALEQLIEDAAPSES